ncbi:prepilin-type N-terminal cleavage/methylation domain-containing protein [Planctomycetales bacterium]|nr:prepilin-type N-terminal cleavage/methylation domain-containing protein [Planctomycetales bacterium]
MQCTNNLKQLSLSLHNYHDVHGGFPAGSNSQVFTTASGDNRDYGVYYSGMVYLWPFIELGARFDQFINAKPVAGSKEPKPWNNTSDTCWEGANQPNSGSIPAFSCPSDATVNVPATTATPTSYCMSRGDAISRDAATCRRGMFPYSAWQKMASVTDGTSNTIAFSEIVAGNKGTALTHKGPVVQRYYNVGSGVLKTDPLNQCGASIIDTNDRNSYVGNTMAYDRGRALMDARVFLCFFNTVNAPNMPNCAEQTGDSNANWGVFSAASNHSGGVNCGLVDGSVRFVSDTVNNRTSGVATPAEKSSGKSDFGVWGAYGSIDGGESVTF